MDDIEVCKLQEPDELWTLKSKTKQNHVYKAKRPAPGIEPGTSSTLKTNHTPRPNQLISDILITLNQSIVYTNNIPTIQIIPKI